MQTYIILDIFEPQGIHIVLLHTKRSRDQFEVFLELYNLTCVKESNVHLDTWTVWRLIIWHLQNFLECALSIDSFWSRLIYCISFCYWNEVWIDRNLWTRNLHIIIWTGAQIYGCGWERTNEQEWSNSSYSCRLWHSSPC